MSTLTKTSAFASRGASGSKRTASPATRFAPPGVHQRSGSPARSSQALISAPIPIPDCTTPRPFTETLRLSTSRVPTAVATTKLIVGRRDTPPEPGAGSSCVTNGCASISTSAVTVRPATTVALALPTKEGTKRNCAICSRWENGTSQPLTSICTGPGKSPRKSTERVTVGSTT